MKRSLALGLGGLAFGVGLLFQAPAAMLGALVEEICQGRCRLAESEGPWWRGEAQLYLRPGETAYWIPAGRLHWRLGLDGLHGGLAQGRLTVVPGGKGLTLATSGIRLPAGLVLSMLPNLPRAGWGGDLELAEARLSKPWLGDWQGEGLLRWHQAQTTVVPGVVLGNYLFRFQRRDGEALFRISSEGGGLALAGEGRLDAKGAWRLDMEARPSAEARGQVEPLLRGIGQPEGGSTDRYRIRWPAGQE